MAAFSTPPLQPLIADWISALQCHPALLGQLIEKYRSPLNRKALVGLRVSGFLNGDTKLYSRFGFDINTVEEFIGRVFRPRKNNFQIDYRGLHFHLNGYSTVERGAALHACLSLAERIEAEFALRTRFIDMGGGCLVNYLESKEQWEEFDRELQRAVKGERVPITFENNGLGYTMIGGEIHGRLATYPYFNQTTRKTFLREVLLSLDPNHAETAVNRARRKNIELRLEPGRSLLDQTGVTVARVVFRKRDSRGDLLVGLEMNRKPIYSTLPQT